MYCGTLFILQYTVAIRHMIFREVGQIVAETRMS